MGIGGFAMTLRRLLLVGWLLLGSSTAHAGDDYAGALSAWTSSCTEWATGLREKAQSCRDQVASGEAASCNVEWELDTGTRVYSPDQADAEAARFDGDAAYMNQYIGDFQRRQDRIAEDEKVIAELAGVTANAEAMLAWQREADDVRANYLWNTLGEVWTIAMSHADVLVKAFTKVKPAKLRRLAKAITAWASDAGDSLLEAIGKLTGAKPKARKKRAKKLIDVLSLAKDVFFLDDQAVGPEVVAERLMLVFGLVGPALVGASAVATGVATFAALSLVLAHVELFAFFEAHGAEMDGLLALQKGNIATLKDRRASAIAELEAIEQTVIGFGNRCTP
jgi:hypothetical protein